ncbi:Alcohol dehydrogenase AD1, partial [Operophtera brumata]
LDVDVKSGQSLQADLASKYGVNKVKFYKCDVTSNVLEDAYESILKEYGYIDIVVNCAGIMNDDRKSALITSSLKAYDIMRVDHGGDGGTIINISSTAALFKASLFPVYAATKSAVLQFSNCLGTQPHYPRSGVRVLTICFGGTDTSLLSKTKLHALDQETENKIADIMGKFPLQKIESAVAGLIEAFKRGDGGSTWLVNADRPAEDITENITKAYDITSQGTGRPPVE